MVWWQTLLMTGGTCLVTLVVTFVWNWIVNKPKQKKEEEAKKEQQRKEEASQLRTELLEAIDNVRKERVEERVACSKDHIELMKTIHKIESDGESQKAGLQAVLKDLLKIRYIEWIHKGYAPMDARDDLERMYQAYHSLGGNGTVTDLRRRFIALPVMGEGAILEEEEHN